MKELLEICTALKTFGNKPAMLATVIHVEGSSYRRPGARMLLTPEGRSWGMISGGCLEHDVMGHACETLKSGQPRTVRYDSTSSDDIIFGTGLGCNGVIDVLVEPLTPDFREGLIESVETCYRTRQRGGLATLIRDAGASAHAFLDPQGNWIGDADLTENLNAFGSVPDEVPAEASLIDGRIFVQTLLPPIHLVIFGGWLDVVPLIRIGKEVGFKISVVDTRERTSSRSLFREADDVLLCPAKDAADQLQIDERTAIVLMAHHFESDQGALGALSGTRPFYLGMLGPKRRQEKILDGLRSEGVMLSDDFIETVHGPAGLDLGVSTPEGIALAIVAEIQATKTGRTADMLKRCNHRTSGGGFSVKPSTDNARVKVVA